MKKIKVYNLLIFLLGLFSLTFGIALVVKSNLGISVSMSIPFVISLKFVQLTLGQWTYIIQGCSVVILAFLLKRLTVKHLMSFAISFLFGLTLDMFNALLAGYTAVTFLERGIVFVLGSIVISVGVAAFIRSNYPMMPFDTFTKEVAIAKNIPYPKFKTGFDIVCCSISLGLSLIFFKGIKGVHIGTLISAVALGSIIGFFLKLMNEHIEGMDLFPGDKVKSILDYNILDAIKEKSLS